MQTITIREFHKKVKELTKCYSIVKVEIEDDESIRFSAYVSLFEKYFTGNTPDECLDSILAAKNGIQVDMPLDAQETIPAPPAPPKANEPLEDLPF